MTTPTGRFAPTPSGPLHFGSLVAALASYCQARARSGRWLLRIEDVDIPRIVAGADDWIRRDLEHFGFEWDGEVLYQSDRLEQYRMHLQRLWRQGDCYACECSRRSLRQQGVASGPLGRIYPGNCRDKGLAPDNHSIRINVETAGTVGFVDGVYGDFELNLPSLVGDFVLRRADLVYSYHLAVVVDDALQGIDEIVRGADLLENTSLHLYLQRRLGLPSPAYIHIPLVNNAQGVKLSKQTGATALDPDRASTLLVAGLRHLGQNPPPELAACAVSEVLDWGIANWNLAAISPRRPALARHEE